MHPKDLARFLADSESVSSDLDVLDDRELEVFSILAQGYSTKQLTSEFGFAATELKSIQRSLQKKLALRSELDLLRSAARRGRAE